MRRSACVLALSIAAATTAGATPPLRTSLVRTLPWGGEPGALGHRPAEESSPEGPMSFDVDASGHVYILDQVNRRVVVAGLDGSTWSFPIPSDTYQDVAIDEAGGVVLLDRLVSQSVTFVDATGRVTSDVLLVGRGIPEGGAVTALLSTADGVSVEVGHLYTVRIADGLGAPDAARTVAPGRPAADGNAWLRVARADPPTAVLVTAWPTMPGAPAHRFARVPFTTPVAQIDGYETDGAGRLWLACHVVVERPDAPFDVVSEAEEVVLVADGGAEVGRATLPAIRGHEEQLRAVRVGGDGALWALIPGADGASLWAVRP